MRIRILVSGSVVWAVGLVLGACHMTTMIVQAKDVKFTEISELRTPEETPVLKVRGLVFHSSLAVDHIDEKKEGDSIQIDVYLTPARKGLSGSFSISIPLDGAQRVLFGPTHSQIWPKI